MTSSNFAAAQKRVLERRRLREVESRAQLVEQRRGLRVSTAALEKLPYPLGRLPDSCLFLWNSVNGREGTRPAFRVGQVDAELLDEELLALLKGQVGEALKYFGSHVREDWSHEIQFALRAILFKLSIWDHNASYGATLQNLSYTDGRSKVTIPSPPTKLQKALHGLLTVGGRYVWDKWESWLIGQESGYEERSSDVRLLSRITNQVSSLYSLTAFFSFLVFLVNGRYRTLVDRILRLRLAPSSSQVNREVSFEYLNRQLVWHAFTEFLLFLLPLVGISRWRRWLSRIWRIITVSMKGGGGEASRTKRGELACLPERTCAICYQVQNPATAPGTEIVSMSAASGGIAGSAQTDITNPYEAMPCGCIYCFVCIAQTLEAEEGEGWVCLRCGELIKQCKPWNGDVLEAARRESSSGRNVGFTISDDLEEAVESQERMFDTSVGEDNPLQDTDTDETLQYSSQWSTVDKESTDTDAPGSETEKH
jgi:peroxin-2